MAEGEAGNGCWPFPAFRFYVWIGRGNASVLHAAAGSYYLGRTRPPFRGFYPRIPMADPGSSILVRRRVRIVMDIEVTVADITEVEVDAVSRHMSRYAAGGDGSWLRESAERDRRLLLAFIANQRRLRAQLTTLAVEYAVNFVMPEDLLHTARDPELERRLILETLEDLGPEDAEFYRDADALDDLGENSAFFNEAFESRLVHAEVFELATGE